MTMSEGYQHLTWKYHELLLRYHGDGKRPGCDNKSVERRRVLSVCHSETETTGLLTWTERQRSLDVIHCSLSL